MKKFYILAAVALVASAACTKVETIDTTPDKAIAFQVANYVSQTKADADGQGHVSLQDESISSFKTNAYYHTAGQSTQDFMVDEEIAWKSATSVWSPSAREYYWPKTGYINFFSYAGTQDPTAKAEGSITYTDMTIGVTDNILVADAAYGYSANISPATHGVDGNANGVPTLFNHVLSKVLFDVIVDATGVSDNKYSYTATITAAKISYRNEGSLNVSFTAPDFSSAVTPQTVSGTAPNTIGWTAASVVNVNLNKVSGDVVVTAAGGSKTATPVTLIAESTVLPQDIDATDVTFEMTYTFASSYDSGTPITETVVVPATALYAAGTPATGLAPSITAWNMNTIYKYHIIIKPNEPIRFDPAVVPWGTVESANTEFIFN